MDFTTHTDQMLAAYKKLHEDPGWRDYVEARVRDMAARHPDLYADLAAQILPETKPISNHRRR
jgi:hypothetical protein